MLKLRFAIWLVVSLVGGGERRGGVLGRGGWGLTGAALVAVDVDDCWLGSSSCMASKLNRLPGVNDAGL